MKRRKQRIFTSLVSLSLPILSCLFVYAKGEGQKGLTVYNSKTNLFSVKSHSTKNIHHTCIMSLRLWLGGTTSSTTTTTITNLLSRWSVQNPAVSQRNFQLFSVIQVHFARSFLHDASMSHYNLAKDGVERFSCFLSYLLTLLVDFK